jgi:Carboxypeptidase regulatory-like domain
MQGPGTTLILLFCAVAAVAACLVLVLGPVAPPPDLAGRVSDAGAAVGDVPSVLTARPGALEEDVPVDALRDGRERSNHGKPVATSADAPGILAGTVVYVDEGGPCPDALLEVRSGRGAEAGEARTGSKGEFHLPDLRAGRYQLMVSPPNGPSVSVRDVEIEAGAVTIRNLVVVEGVTVTGLVTDTRTGEPVVGAEVSLQGSERLESRTDESGRYRIAGLASDRAKVYVGAPGYLRTWVDAVPGVDGAEAVCDIELDPGARIHGRVFGPTGEPVAGARILHDEGVIRSKKRATATSGDDGTFLLEGVPAGWRTLTARAEGLASAVVDGLAVSAGSEVSEVEIHLAPGGAISGKLIDEAGEPVAGASVRISAAGPGGEDLARSGLVEPAEDGSFRARHLRPGIYRVRVVATDHQAESRDAVVVVEGMETAGVDFVLRGGASIAGKVLTLKGVPIAGAKLHAWPRQGVRTGAWRAVDVISLADGSFRLTGLEAGAYQVNVSKVGFTGRGPDSVPVGTDGLEIRLQQQATLVGTVIVGSDGAPAPVAKVRVHAAGETDDRITRSVSVASPDGEFSVRGLEPGRYELEASTEAGLRSLRVPVSISGGETPEPVTLTLRPAASIRGTVLLPDGSPCEGALLQALPQDPVARGARPGFTRSDTEGRFVIRALRPGRYLVRARHVGWSPAEEFTAVNEGGDVQLTPRLREPGGFRLSVTDPDGVPVEVREGEEVALRLVLGRASASPR